MIFWLSFIFLFLCSFLPSFGLFLFNTLSGCFKITNYLPTLNFQSTQLQNFLTSSKMWSSYSFTGPFPFPSSPWCLVLCVPNLHTWKIRKYIIFTLKSHACFLKHQEKNSPSSSLPYLPSLLPFLQPESSKFPSHIFLHGWGASGVNSLIFPFIWEALDLTFIP